MLGVLPGGFEMNTHIHVSGLSYFCTDEKLRQAFTPFGRVVLAQVLRDECGHSLGLGLVHMASAKDVEGVFSAHQLFEVSGSRVDLWEPADMEDLQGGQRAFYVRRGSRAAQAGQDTGHEKSRKAFQRLAVLRHRLFQSMVPSSWTVKH
jgi:RNA recognition motif-containing protein